MKKLLPYLIGVVILLVLALIIAGNRADTPRRFIERITMRQRDKIPYGTSVARTLMPSLFPNSTVYSDNKSPGNWDSIRYTSYNQAVVLVSTSFQADDEELSRIVSFAQQGNYVFIIAKYLSEEASNFFNFTYNSNSIDELLTNPEDSLSVRLQPPMFSSGAVYLYPGRRYESTFLNLDNEHTLVLGRNEKDQPDFIEYKTGNGRIFIHLAPLAFSNYFILHGNNNEYFRQVMSVIPQHTEKILWNEYYLSKPNSAGNSDEPNLFRVLFRYDAFKWGLLLGLFLLVLMVLLGTRRRRKMIPPYKKPKNDSLDFVRTLGRLYFDSQDHNNLAGKMGIYFLEHVRSRYQLPTQILDEAFIESLHQKTGYGTEELSRIVGFIRHVDIGGNVTEEQLALFHKQLESFYQNT